MNLKDLEQANLFIKNIKILETLAKSRIRALNVTYLNKTNDYVPISEELANVLKKAMQEYADEFKIQLKYLGVDYE